MDALKLSGKTLVIGLTAVGLVTILLLSTCASPPAVDVEATAQSLARLWVAQTREAEPAAGRAGRSGDTPVPAAPTPTRTAGPTQAPTDTSAPSPAPTVTSTRAPTATRLLVTIQPPATTVPSPVLTATSPSAPACAVAVDPQLAAGWDRGKLGCPTADAAITWAALAQFQRGYMLWRNDTDWTYALHWQNGANAAFGDVTTGRDAWKWDESFPDGRGLTPPPGFYEPVRGFGYVWYNFLGGPDSVIGWATEQEKGFCANLQPFEKGLIFHSSNVQYCQDELYNWAANPDFTPLFFTIYDNGTWERR